MDCKPSTGTTTILADLNDDCLLEVFEYLDLLDLSCIADVCGHFRETAKSCFARSKFKSISLTHESDNHLNWRSQPLKVSQVFRNFGAFFIRINSGILDREFIELVLMYCSDALVEWTIKYSDITDDMVILMRPLFERLQKLTVHYCRCTQLLLRMLSLWSPELRQLKFISLDPLNDGEAASLLRGLHQPFPQLEKISFIHVDFRNDDIDKMLLCNPQLKEIELRDCSCSSTGNTILQSIAEHVPQIEALRMRLGFAESAEEQIYRSIHYFGRLSNLSSLEMDFRLYASHDINSIMAVIGASNAALTTLHLHCLELNDGASQFVESISRLTKLETLKLRYVINLDASHIADICKHLTQLAVLDLLIKWPTPRAKTILKFIRMSEKLQLLNISVIDTVTERTCIDVNAFKEMVSVAAIRRTQKHLKVVLDDACYALNIPTDIARAHEASLSVVTQPFELQSDFI